MRERNHPMPEGPDPEERGATFLGWLKKRGGMRTVQDCQRKCRENGFEAKYFVDSMGSDYIRLYRAGGGDKVIKLEKPVWADQWMTYYDLEVPHHRHWTKLKE
ncbi:MAG: hypothetical protein PHX88_02065 [Methanoculleus horonobensis]|nr:hypothetical protein [Methanoculleus horonobensis]MDD4252010.1 hypothetical protein [Methanoculleus horonobensis]